MKRLQSQHQVKAFKPELLLTQTQKRGSVTKLQGSCSAKSGPEALL
jgi:hypothetical protein